MEGIYISARFSFVLRLRHTRVGAEAGPPERLAQYHHPVVPLHRVVGRDLRRTDGAAGQAIGTPEDVAAYKIAKS